MKERNTNPAFNGTLETTLNDKNLSIKWVNEAHVAELKLDIKNMILTTEFE